jgi:hypothetical protein
MGKKRLMNVTSIGNCVRNGTRRNIAFGRGDRFPGEITAELVLSMAAEPGAKIFAKIAARQIFPKQTFNGFGYERRRASIADRACDPSVLADCSTQTEVIGIRQLAIVLDLLAFDTNIGYPVLATAIGAASHIEFELLIKARQPLFKFVNEPSREPLGLRDGQLAELLAGTGDGAAPERRALDLKSDCS